MDAGAASECLHLVQREKLGLPWASEPSKLTALARSLQQGPPFLILPKQSTNSGQTFQIDESMGNMAGGMPAQSGKQPGNIRSLKRLVINAHQSRLLLTPDSVIYIQGLEKMDFFFVQPLLEDEESMADFIQIESNFRRGS